MIKTVTVSGITAVDFDPLKKTPFLYLSDKFVWTKNKSDSVIYVSADENVVPGAEGTAEIPAGGITLICMPPLNLLYYSGSGDIEIHTSEVAVCPFECGSSGGGGGGADDYPPLSNKPKINGVTLIGDKSLEDLNIHSITNAQIDDLF